MEFMSNVDKSFFFSGPDPKILYRNKPPLFLLVAFIDFFFFFQRYIDSADRSRTNGFTLKINAMNKKQYTII